MPRTSSTLFPKSANLFAFVYLATIALALPSRVATANPCLQGLIEERLRCIPGLEFREIAGGQVGIRTFDLSFLQPEDHNRPAEKNFKQRLVLHHRSFSAPMILQTSGYLIFSVAPTELMQRLRGNQLQIEHRFFAGSIADNPDWSKLTIAASAADFHRITLAFRQIYGGKWLNTGASKGGMTSVYHRYFYPDDLDGTVAYVAPQSYKIDDERYVDFLEDVGGTIYQNCRAKLETLQQSLLRNSASILPMIQGSYDLLGSRLIAFEHAVYELPFAFWQYGNPRSQTSGCSAVPDEHASARQLFAFLQTVNSVDRSYEDSPIKMFQPYYFQAAHQLGSPAVKFSHLGETATQLETYLIQNYLSGLPVPIFQEDAMPAVRDWLSNEGQGLLFIYGGLDPWTAAAFEPSAEAAADQHLFTAPGGNHGTIIAHLERSDQTRAWEIIANWAGLDIAEIQPHDSAVQTLEEQEFQWRRRLGRTSF